MGPDMGRRVVGWRAKATGKADHRAMQDKGPHGAKWAARGPACRHPGPRGRTDAARFEVRHGRGSCTGAPSRSPRWRSCARMRLVVRCWWASPMRPA